MYVLIQRMINVNFTEEIYFRKLFPNCVKMSFFCVNFTFLCQNNVCATFIFILC